MIKSEKQMIETGIKIVDRNNNMGKELLSTKNTSVIKQYLNIEFTDEMYDELSNLSVSERKDLLRKVQSELKKYKNKKRGKS